jgi:hypothetical protein
MHTLCHELNALGLDARLLLTSNLSPSPDKFLNPALNTPVVNHVMERDWPELSQEAIVICADGLRGNPFNARRIVRYVLGNEGVPNGPEPDEFKVYHSRAFPRQKVGRHRTLFLLPIDLGVFNDKGVATREQDMIWRGKGAKYCVDPPAGCVDITYNWPPTRETLAAELRRTRRMYSYDALSCTNLEAILCGATVVLKHMSYDGRPWTREDLEATENGSGGYAFGDEDFEIDRAERTRQETVDNIRYQIASFRLHLLEFVDATQHHYR